MTVVEVNAAAIPVEFKDRAQWLLWDKSNDTPRRPHWKGDFAVSWSDPDEWHSFDEALEAAEQHDSWGVGYVTALDNDDHPAGKYGVIDIDGGETEDGDLKDWVPDLGRFEDAMTYMEYSPSGTGLHIPFTGEPPEWWTDGQLGDHEGVDVLTNKFCTFTGDRHPASGSAVAEIDVTPWLLEAYHAVHGEYPRKTTGGEGQDWSGGDEWLTEDDVEDALSALDPDMSYSEWRDVAYAVHDFDDGPNGQSLFESWSRSSSKYDDDAEEYIERFWSDTDQGDGITVATLIHKAKQAGWSPSSSRRADRAQERYKESQSGDGVDVTPIQWDLVRSLFADPEVPEKRARRVAASALQMRYEYLYIDTEDRLMKYHEPAGVFERGGERHVKRVLVRELEQHFSTHDRNEILAMIQDEAAVDVNDLNAAEDDRRLLCLENGVLNLDTLLNQAGAASLDDVELLDHSPDFKFTRSVPVEFDPDAEAESAEEFLGEIVETAGQKRTLEEMMGAALHPEYLKSKFLFLFGEGSNGKGIYFQLISELLGSKNVEGRGLHELADERFAKADLHGKLANIGGDIDDRKLKNVGELKRLTSGTDVVTAERKYGQPFKFVNSATLFFAANEPPAIEDQKRSMARRLVPIRMPVEFVEDPDEDDPYQKPARDEDTLLAEMTTDEELAGLLNLALAGMKRLHDTGDVSLERGPMERLEHYQRFSDPIYRFATECLVKQRGETVQKEDVYEVYKAFSDVEGHAVRHNSVFWREFKRVFHVEETQPRDADGNKGPRQLIGTGFTNIALERYAPEKLAAKYTPAGDDSDGDDDGGPPFDHPKPVAVGEIDPSRQDTASAIGVVEFQKFDGRNTQNEDAPAWTATLKDDTGEAELVAWEKADIPPFYDDFGAFEADALHVKGAETGEYEGDVQLVIGEETVVERAQVGAGETSSEDPGDGQDQLDDTGSSQPAEADGGQQTASVDDETDEDGEGVPEDAEGTLADARRLVDLLDGQYGVLERGELIKAAAQDHDLMPPDRAKSAVEKALKNGLLMETGRGLKPT